MVISRKRLKLPLPSYIRWYHVLLFIILFAAGGAPNAGTPALNRAMLAGRALTGIIIIYAIARWQRPKPKSNTD